MRTRLLTRFILCCIALLAAVPGAHAQNVPAYRIEAAWPKMPLRNNWLIQAVPNIVADKDDHIWVLSRSHDITVDESGASSNPPRTDCCIAAPEVLEFDNAGNLIRSWGGPGYHPDWPDAIHTIIVDREGNVWISANGRGSGILKFTGDGKFLWDFGHRGPKPVQGQRPQRLKEDNQQTDILPDGVFFFNLDEDAREIYVVEGKRVLVYDMDSGGFKRGWGGHGIPLSEISNDPTPPYDWKSGPPPDQKEFSPVLHCVHISVDGLVYVCERGSDRIQVFTKQGKFVTSFFVHPSTPARGPESECGACRGTTWNITFSHDAGQKYILVVDGTNNKIWIHDRKSGNLVSSIGGLGRMAGQFFGIDAVAMDSLGNLYTGEVLTGKRVQKFILTNGDAKHRPHPHD
jgi:hypothetical protein